MYDRKNVKYSLKDCKMFKYVNIYYGLKKIIFIIHIEHLRGTYFLLTQHTELLTRINM